VTKPLMPQTHDHDHAILISTHTVAISPPCSAEVRSGEDEALQGQEEGKTGKGQLPWQLEDFGSLAGYGALSGTAADRMMRGGGGEDGGDEGGGEKVGGGSGGGRQSSGARRAAAAADEIEEVRGIDGKTFQGTGVRAQCGSEALPAKVVRFSLSSAKGEEVGEGAARLVGAGMSGTMGRKGKRAVSATVRARLGMLMG
jgi:hypothetical protein